MTRDSVHVGFMELLCAVLIRVVVQRVECSWNAVAVAQAFAVAVIREDYLAVHRSSVIRGKGEEGRRGEDDAGWEKISYGVGWRGVFTRSHGGLAVSVGARAMFTPWWWRHRSP